MRAKKWPSEEIDSLVGRKLAKPLNVVDLAAAAELLHGGSYHDRGKDHLSPTTEPF